MKRILATLAIAIALGTTLTGTVEIVSKPAGGG